MPNQGRPSIYSEELATEICTELSEGKSLRSICARDDMPNISTVWRWIQSNESFRKQYARAKEESADSHADRINEIAEKVLSGEYKDTNAARVALDAFKWTASKLRPKRYGDRLDLGNADDKSFQITVNKHISDES